MAGNEGWGEWGRYILEEVKRLNDCVVALRGDLAALRKEREGKVDTLETSLETRLREVETEVARLGEKLKLVAIAQAAFTSVAAAIAGLVSWLKG